jgi:hypothetical protein
MSHAMPPEPAAEPGLAPADVSRSLFWDDVRAGLKVVCVGVILVLVSELSKQFHLPEFLVGAILLVGSLLCLLGLGIGTAIPTDTGVRPTALLAAGCAGLGLLALVVHFLDPFDLPVGGALAAILGAVALVLFALVLRGCTTYIGHRPLTAAARSFVSLAAAFALFVLVLAILALAPLPPSVQDLLPAVRLLADLLAICVVSIVVYIAWSTSDAIVRVRQGQPVEAPRLPLSAAQLAAEELRRRQEIIYTQPPHPHFSEAEVHFFHADDSRAAGAIVVLMTGIFAVGVVLYTVVAWSVAD